MPLLHEAISRYIYQECGDRQVISIYCLRPWCIDNPLDDIVCVCCRPSVQTAGTMELHGECLH